MFVCLFVCIKLQAPSNVNSTVATIAAVDTLNQPCGNNGTNVSSAYASSAQSFSPVVSAAIANNVGQNCDNSSYPFISSGSILVAVTPDGKFVYACDCQNDLVRIIDVATNQIVGEPINVGNFPYDIAITPDGKYVYVANSNSNSVSVISIASKVVVATIAVGSAPHGVAVTPGGKFVYVTNSGDTTVSKIRVATQSVVATITVGNSPWGIAITPDGKSAYVSNSASDTISIINLAL